MGSSAPHIYMICPHAAMATVSVCAPGRGPRRPLLTVSGFFAESTDAHKQRTGKVPYTVRRLPFGLLSIAQVGDPRAVAVV